MSDFEDNRFFNQDFIPNSGEYYLLLLVFFVRYTGIGMYGY